MLPSGSRDQETVVGGPSSAFRRVRSGRQPFLPVSAPNQSSPVSRFRTTFLDATVNLVQVYKRVRPDFHFAQNVPRRSLTKPSEPCHNEGRDNVSHDYILHVNDVLTDPANPTEEYVVLDMLGTGTFGQVVKCFCKSSSSLVAVKIVKNQQAYFNQAWMEIGILRMLHKDHSEEDTRHIVRFLHHFVFHGHLCLVFEKLSINLYELLKQNRYAGVNLRMLRSFLTQLLKALCVLVEAEVVHCDVKPENILLSSLDSADLKLIDFGSACQLQHPIYSYVQSRFYRSPEILLGMPDYDSKIDMWSLGCVAGELFLGIPMFPGQNGMNMLCRISEMMGDFPDMFLRRCRNTTKFFKQASSGSNFRVFQLKTVAEYEEEHRVVLPEWRRYFKERRLRDVIMSAPHRTQSSGPDETALRESFVDLLHGMLKIDPAERWSPMDALQHPFITAGPLPDGQPWQPAHATRRHGTRTRPVAIDSHNSNGGSEAPISASAPTFAGRGRFQPTSFPDQSNSQAAGSAVAHGASSYVPASIFPAYGNQTHQTTQPPSSIPVASLSDVHNVRDPAFRGVQSPVPMQGLTSVRRRPSIPSGEVSRQSGSSPVGIPRRGNQNGTGSSVGVEHIRTVEDPCPLDKQIPSTSTSVNEPGFRFPNDNDDHGMVDVGDTKD